MQPSITETRRKTGYVLLISSSSFVILGCFWLILLVAYPKIEKLRALNQAQAQWEAQSISSYRMVVSYKSKQYGQNVGACQEQVDVQNRIIVANSTARQPCRSQSLTVPDLFQLIEHDTDVIRWNQCKVLIISAIYDTKLGYPRYINYKWENASFSNLGIDLLKIDCTDLAMFPPDIDDIEILSLEPIKS